MHEDWRTATGLGIVRSMVAHGEIALHRSKKNSDQSSTSATTSYIDCAAPSERRGAAA
jgi:hypothetical protein